MPEIRRLVEKDTVAFIILDADIYIRLSNKSVFRVVEVVYAGMSQRAVSEMIDGRRILEILRYSIGNHIDLVIYRIEIIDHALHRIGREGVVRVEEKDILAPSAAQAEVAGL